MLLAALVAGLLISAACSSSAPANANKATNTTTTTTTTTSNTTSNSSAPTSNTNTATSNTSSTSNANSTAQEGSKQDFTLVNATGVEIDKVFISPHDVDDWQEDILGQDTLPSGQSVDIKFHRNETAAMWDLRIEDKQGNYIEWENLNLLKISKITLHFDKASGKATAETE